MVRKVSNKTNVKDITETSMLPQEISESQVSDKLLQN